MITPATTSRARATSDARIGAIQCLLAWMTTCSFASRLLLTDDIVWAPSYAWQGKCAGSTGASSPAGGIDGVAATSGARLRR